LLSFFLVCFAAALNLPPRHKSTSNSSSTGGVDFTVVYTYVDGNDKQVQQDAMEALNRLPGNRIRDRNELKYSLRSLTKYMPWYKGDIVIVCNRNPPLWLNTEHPRIRIVRHKDIIDEDYLPTFNSAAIELNFWKIPDIGERILYFNDDFFLGNYVTPRDFWSPSGQPNQRYTKKLNGGKDAFKKLLKARKFLWRASVYRTSWKVSQLTKQTVHSFHKHTPYSILTSTLKKIWEHFPEDVERTMLSKSRDYEDLRTTLMISWLQTDFGLSNPDFVSDADGEYLFVKTPKLETFVHGLSWVAQNRPKFFNVADYKEADVWEDAFLTLMEGMYHVPSEFELQKRED